MTYYCPFCQRQFDTLYALRVHVKLVHLSTSNEICPCCNREYKRLASHLARYAMHDMCHAVLTTLLVSQRDITYKRVVKRVAHLLTQPINLRELKGVPLTDYAKPNIRIYVDNMYPVELYDIGVYLAPLDIHEVNVLTRYALCQVIQKITNKKIRECTEYEREFEQEKEKIVQKISELVMTD